MCPWQILGTVGCGSKQQLDSEIRKAQAALNKAKGLPDDPALAEEDPTAHMTTAEKYPLLEIPDADLTPEQVRHWCAGIAPRKSGGSSGGPQKKKGPQGSESGPRVRESPPQLCADEPLLCQGVLLLLKLLCTHQGGVLLLLSSLLLWR